MTHILQNKNDTLVVKVVGELDMLTAQEFRETVEKAMSGALVRNMIIDLDKAGFIDSSGIGVILGRYRKIKAQNGVMVLWGMNENIKRILEMSGILSFIPFCSSEKESWEIIAKKAFKGA